MSNPLKPLTDLPAGTVIKGTLGEKQFTVNLPSQALLSPNHVSISFQAISESVISIRNAAKCSKINASKREILKLSDEASDVARQLIHLADELRRAAQ